MIRVLNRKLLAKTKYIADVDEPYLVYIGRPTLLGNPFTHLPLDARSWTCKGHTIEVVRVQTRDEAVRCFRMYLHEQMKQNSVVWKEVLELARAVAREPEENWGLVCYCAPQNCHGNVLKNAIEYILKEGLHL